MKMEFELIEQINFESVAYPSPLTWIESTWELNCD